MRWIIGALALLAAPAAHAQYTITLNGTGTYAEWSNAGIHEALDYYGESVSFSTTFTLDSLKFTPDPIHYVYEYSGRTLSVTVNNVLMPNLIPDPTAYLAFSGDTGFTTSSFILSNDIYPKSVLGNVGLGVIFSAPELSGSEITADIMPYFINDTLLSVIYLGAHDGIGVYDFRLTSFLISGTRPPLVLATVPEPAAWAMLIGGFGLVGGVMRVRTRKLRFA